MGFVVASDFTGKFEIHVSGVKAATLDGYIDRYEDYYLKRLFGLDLYNTWLGSVDSAIPDPIYTFLKNPFDYQENQELLQSRGVKDMLLGLIYFEYNKDNRVQQTIHGKVSLKQEVSTPASNREMSTIRNEAVWTYKAIQKYICYNLSTYPDYAGVDEEFLIFGGL